uniref:Uncharacterized protein n=1 Tax=Anopheles melas TaxID=34690 RepID=A0A182TLE9_9DIPT
MVLSDKHSDGRTLTMTKKGFAHGARERSRGFRIGSETVAHHPVAGSVSVSVAFVSRDAKRTRLVAETSFSVTNCHPNKVQGGEAAHENKPLMSSFEEKRPEKCDFNATFSAEPDRSASRAPHRLGLPNVPDEPATSDRRRSVESSLSSSPATIWAISRSFFRSGGLNCRLASEPWLRLRCSCRIE